ncbi:DUF3035 domain-containing protein [Thalassorhabdomicrobium marinisediminis]|uniref:DUF3035 domain-containing protein n=1 Tax=Thalassorhabdomicrobium marinisediminis TaxID=2170577 RepID=UPI00249385C2|nr:DUF3035 domain-containing protein [Thalassorhabdomicrobium marinisediminis]
MVKPVLSVAAMVALAACSGGGSGARDLRNDGSGPNEFLVETYKPLVMPGTLTTLPVPTPGGANRADPTPVANAVAAMGGNPNAAAN